MTWSGSPPSLTTSCRTSSAWTESSSTRQRSPSDWTRGEPLAAGSAEEIELRACAVHAVELLVAELHRQGVPVMAMGLDHVLWYRGQGARYRQGPAYRRDRSQVEGEGWRGGAEKGR
ncbi:queuosine salvage family protein [Archangium lipolyticum]|uniref:queuosine salvage family protein n=1 Tax=Archangium lipolyticum TaxID=2970465 RepID=UPI0038995C5B